METTNHTAPDLEATTLGALLLEPYQFPEVSGILTADCFVNPANARIYEAIRRMADRGEAIDMITVTERLKHDGNLKSVGGAVYLTGLTLRVGSAVHLVNHAMHLRDLATRRNITTGAGQLLAKATDETADLDDVLDILAKLADSAGDAAVGGAPALPLSRILSDALAAAEKRQALQQSGKVTGIPTGLSDLDKITGGWQGSQLIILAARPAMGKTALALHFAKSAAQAGTPVAMFSLEMANVSLADRLILSECGTEADRYRAGRFTDTDWRGINGAAARLENLPIHIDDNAMASMRRVRSVSKVLQRRGQCGMGILDYLQLVDNQTDKKAQRNREQEVAAASRTAKLLAKELNVPVILLSQLSRNVESRGDKTPILSDLRESGAIEQDADIVAFIHRPAYYGVEEMNTRIYGNIKTEGLGILTVAKQRDGATGTVPFRHNPSMTKITDYRSDVTTPTTADDDGPF